MIREAVARIEEWTPKGVHFGWERAFKNKGKFPMEMTKADARGLVRRILLEGYLEVSINHRDGQLAEGEYRIVADAGHPIGTRGQRALRIVIVRDDVGYVIENAFPVRVA